MGACDIKGIGDNVIMLSVRKQVSLPGADIMDLIAAAAVAVGRDRRGEFFKHNIG